MRLKISVFLLLVLCGLAVEGRQQQVRGQVINRDGAAQQCQVDFYQGTTLKHRVYTDGGGFFYLVNPELGAYRAVVVQGSRQQELQVTIDSNGLHPPTFVVGW